MSQVPDDKCEQIINGICPRCGERWWYDRPQDWKCVRCGEIQTKTIAETMNRAKLRKTLQ